MTPTTRSLVRSVVLAAMVALASMVVFAQDPGGTAKPGAADISGTEWVGKDGPEKRIITFRFEKGGVLAYFYAGVTYRNGTWTQDGNTLYFEMNTKYREFRGRVEGDAITGDSWNVVDQKWSTAIYKYTRPATAPVPKTVKPASRLKGQ